MPVLLDTAAKANVKVTKAILAAYVRRIKRGEITIENVPIQIRDLVQEMLDGEV